MGYRSQVYLGVSQPLNKQMLKNPAIVKLLGYSDSIQKTDTVILYHWEWLKWYANCEGFEDITALEALFDEWDDENSDQYRFFRSGENFDDIDERGESEDFHFAASVHIHVDVYGCPDEVTFKELMGEK